MSESMVERVARAIADERHRIAAEHNLREIDHEITEANIYAFGPAKVFESDRLIARAAIEAMRNPTDEMKRDGWQELRKHNDIQTRLGNSLVGVETPTYQAMIDAASQGR